MALDHKSSKADLALGIRESSVQDFTVGFTVGVCYESGAAGLKVLGSTSGLPLVFWPIFTRQRLFWFARDNVPELVERKLVCIFGVPS